MRPDCSRQILFSRYPRRTQPDIDGNLPSCEYNRGITDSSHKGFERLILGAMFGSFGIETVIVSMFNAHLHFIVENFRFP